MNSPTCANCGGRTYLSRREPHPTRPADREIHTFRCASCEHLGVQEVDLNPADLDRP